MKVGRMIGPRRKQGLSRYLSYCHIVICISSGLNKLCLVPRGALKPVEAPKHDCGREKKNLEFYFIFWEVTNSPKTDIFSEGIIQKTEK
jgi:hypothetical protein